MIIDFPKGDHRRPPAFFIPRFEARPLGFINIGDLKLRRCLLEPCLESFFNFPKTAAEPMLRKSLVGVLGALGRVLSCLERLLGSLGALLEPPGASLAASLLGPLKALWGGSPGRLGRLLGPLGRLRGDPKQYKN